MAALKESIYTCIAVPEDFGPREVTVDDHWVKRFAFAQDDYPDWSFVDSPFGGRIGQPAILANELCTIFYEKYDMNTVVGLHTDEELWFDNPVRVGERVTITGRYTETYEKRGKGHVVLESQAHGEVGRSLLRHRGVGIVRVDDGAGGGRAEPPARRVSMSVLEGADVASRARLDLEPGTPLRSLVKQMTPEQVAVYSNIGIYHRNLHNNLDVAHSAGLDRPIAQGEMQACYIAELATAFFGAAFLTSGWLRL